MNERRDRDDIDGDGSGWTSDAVYLFIVVGIFSLPILCAIASKVL